MRASWSGFVELLPLVHIWLNSVALLQALGHSQLLIASNTSTHSNIVLG